ncbi:hypothetical protein Tco_0082615, partial [Tanacetum coccineum]
ATYSASMEEDLPLFLVFFFQTYLEDDQEQLAEDLTAVFTLSPPKYEKDVFGDDALFKGLVLAGTALPVGTRVGKFHLPVGTGVDMFGRVELRSTIPD